MFEDLTKELDKLQNTIISIPIKTDQKGFLDKQCPNDKCLYKFKVLNTDWVRKSRDEIATCPMCGHSEPSDKWYTTEQMEHAKGEAFKQARYKINSALNSGVQKFNLSQRRNNSFIQISMKLDGKVFKPVIIPAKCEALFEKTVKCNECHNQFAIVGSAFFCPFCGVNNIEETFRDSIENIRLSLLKIGEIKNIFIKEGLKDQAENITRQIIESSICSMVSIFQAYADKYFKKHSSDYKIRKNIFQNLYEGSKAFKQIYGFAYSDIFDDNKINKLNILFNKRHLLEHKSGIVDKSYISKTEDKSQKIGQRIIIIKSDALFMIESTKVLAEQIKKRCSEASKHC